MFYDFSSICVFFNLSFSFGFFFSLLLIHNQILYIYIALASHLNGLASTLFSNFLMISLDCDVIFQLFVLNV